MTGESGTKTDVDTSTPQTDVTESVSLKTNGSMTDATNEPPPAPKPNRAERRLLVRQNKKIQSFVVGMQSRNKKSQDALKSKKALILNRIGNDEFEALKTICTIKTPEQKDDKGNIVQQAGEFVNWRAFVIEASNLIVLRRQARITAGTRKKTTGRGSNRTKQRHAVKHILERGQKAIQNNEPVSEVKV